MASEPRPDPPGRQVTLETPAVEPEVRGNGWTADAPEANSVEAIASPRSRALTIVIALVVAAAAVFGGFRGWKYLDSYESTDDAQIDGHISAISSRIDGTVTRVLVDDTQAVQAGQQIAEIDARDYQVSAEKARADLAQAEAQVESARRDYEAAVARERQSEASNEKAQNDAARYQELYRQHAASREDYEERARVANVDAAAIDADRASAAAASKAIASREAAVKSARAAVDQATLNLSYTKIITPIDGVVGKKTVEVGQRIQPGQELLAIVPLDNLWVTANFKETQLRRMHIGQRVTISVDALGRSYNGYVAGFAGASGEKYSMLPPENATGNYVKVVQRFPVRIRFDDGQNNDHRLRPGMSVEPTVWLK